MNVPYGDIPEDATVHWQWGSNDADGASITRATDGTIAVYKDNGTTESTAGVTDTEDFDSLTGVHAITIDTSADAFYATGSNYTVVLQGATIDGQTVNAPLFSFSIENRTTFPKADYPTNFASMGIEADGHVHGDLKEWAGNTVTASSGNPDVNVESIDDIDAPTTWKASINSEADTAIADASLATAAELAKVPKSDGVVTWNATAAAQIQSEANDALTAYDPPTRTEATSDKNEILTILGTPADADLATDIATIDSSVDTLLTRVTSTLFSGITSLAEWLGLLAGKQVADATALTELKATGSGSGTFDESTDSLEALRDHIADGTNLTEAGGTGNHLTDLGGMSTGMKAEVNAEADTALSDYDGPTRTEATSDKNEVLAILGTPAGADLAADIAAVTAPTAAQVADAVWEEAIGDHSGTSGSTAEQLAAAGAAGDPWDTALPGSYIAGDAGYIIGNLVATLTASGVTIESPVTSEGELQLVSNDGYYNADSRALSFTYTGKPSFTGGTPTLILTVGGTSLSKTGTVVSSTQIRFDLTEAETAMFTAPGKGIFATRIALVTSGNVVTLEIGTLTIKKPD